MPSKDPSTTTAIDDDLPIPEGWSDDEAEAVVGFVFGIYEALWDRYGSRIKARSRRAARATDPASAPPATCTPDADPRDDPPF
jgi:hypothetical protein